MKTLDILMPYHPRNAWKTKIHRELREHRFAVLVAHRRFGKTVGALNHMLMRAIENKLQMPRYAYIAPYRAQAKSIAWNYMKQYTAPLAEYRKINESELKIELLSNYPHLPGAVLCIHGADNPDSIRGMYWDGVILDEYAQMKRELWEEVILPALSDRRGWALFIGTPKGQNAFYEIYELARRTKGWYVGMYRADETGIFTAEDLETLQETMGDAAYRQEMLCDFTASANDILITIDLIAKSLAKHYLPGDIEGAEVVLGVDVARFGDDDTVAMLRKGLVAFKPWRWHGLNNVEAADQIGQIILEYTPHAVFVDAGRGEGVIDILRKRGFTVMEIPFGSRAIDHARYANRVTEMYDKIKKWLMENGSIPDDPALKGELTARTYNFDTRGRMILEPKDKYKERMGDSPDAADALALTFAAPILGPAARNGMNGAMGGVEIIRNRSASRNRGR
ncbi:MAG: terminase family protein [Synergistaceae bacterium]|nr:terminase family protein [Synergistaceae bacterium]